MIGGMMSPEAILMAERRTCTNCKHFHGWYSYSAGAVELKCLQCGCEKLETAPPPKRIIVDGVIYGPVEMPKGAGIF